MTDDLVKVSAHNIVPRSSGASVPAIVADAGDDASSRFVEFFTRTKLKPATQYLYARAIRSFFAWCEPHGLTLNAIEPTHVAAYVEEHSRNRSASVVNLDLSGIRAILQWFTDGGVLRSNPASSIRGHKRLDRRGETSVEIPDEFRDHNDRQIAQTRSNLVTAPASRCPTVVLTIKLYANEALVRETTDQTVWAAALNRIVAAEQAKEARHVSSGSDRDG